MKIRMRNTIQFDERSEVVDQLLTWKCVGDYSYLLSTMREKGKGVVSQVSWSRAGDDPFLESQNHHAFSKR